MARKNTVPILLAATVAGGLTLGGTAAAAAAVAQTYTAAPNVAMQPYPPRPFNPFAFVFLGPDPFAELDGLAREGVLVGGPGGAGGAGGAGAGGAGADGAGGAGADGRGADGRGGSGADGRGADGGGADGADGANAADHVVEPVVAGAVPVEQVQVAEPETVNDTNNCSNGNCNNNGPMWWGNGPQWNNTGPGAWTRNDTQNDNGAGQPVIGPGSAGGNDGIVPMQNAVQNAEGAPEGVAEPAVDLSEEEPAEESEEGFEEEPEEESFDEGTFDEGESGMGPQGVMGGGPGPVAGPQLPFTGAPMGVAAAGAGLLAVALGCTLLSARRRRSTDAK
ncbi:hypothetical protein [Microbispora bryophytorum]|uniref:hypothetical protein n=1 Tax=Microbispora bryophytorum TaxID=1460882 RepID=UPI0033D30C5F